MIIFIKWLVMLEKWLRIFITVINKKGDTVIGGKGKKIFMKVSYLNIL